MFFWILYLENHETNFIKTNQVNPFGIDSKNQTIKGKNTATPDPVYHLSKNNPPGHLKVLLQNSLGLHTPLMRYVHDFSPQSMLAVNGITPSTNHNNMN